MATLAPARRGAHWPQQRRAQPSIVDVTPPWLRLWFQEESAVRVCPIPPLSRNCDGVLPLSQNTQRHPLTIVLGADRDNP
jgi:hypothetical protein